MAELKPQGRKPKLTREDCDDIRRMYADRTRNIQAGNLAHLFHVTTSTINRVLNGVYTPLEDHEENIAKNLPGPLLACST